MEQTRAAIVKAERSHGPALARIHQDALPDDFLPSLGLEFLERVYYPATFESSHGANLVALDQGAAVGFVTIAHDTAAFTRDVLRGRLTAMAWSALRAAARRPSRLPACAEVLWSVVSRQSDPVAGEIVLIAVDSAHRGRGLGKALVAAALAHLRGHGADRCRTKTLASNTSVIRMYEQMGWHVRDTFRLIGRDYVTVVGPVPLVER